MFLYIFPYLLRLDVILIFAADTEFLLRILRYKKFSQLESRKAIETYWNMRKNNAKWYQNIDTRAKDFQAVLDDQWVIAYFIQCGVHWQGTQQYP